MNPPVVRNKETFCPECDDEAFFVDMDNGHAAFSCDSCDYFYEGEEADGIAFDLGWLP